MPTKALCLCLELFPLQTKPRVLLSPESALVMVSRMGEKPSGCASGRLPYLLGVNVSRTSLVSFALILVMTCVTAAWADPLSNEMSSMNARWDAAINNADFDALLPMYASDASLMPPGAQPLTGPTAIRDFFAGRGRSVRNHKLELVNVLALGNFAYVTSHFTATLVVNEEARPISGSTVRLLERQSDGEWKIKSHIFVRE